MHVGAGAQDPVSIDAVFDRVHTALTASLADDWVLRTAGVDAPTGSDPGARSAAAYYLLLHWHEPHLGHEVAIQRLDLDVRQRDGTPCPEDAARVLVRRAATVLTSRAAWSDLPVVRVAQHADDVESCRFSVLYWAGGRVAHRPAAASAPVEAWMPASRMSGRPA